jgi:hypothetical protein
VFFFILVLLFVSLISYRKKTKKICNIIFRYILGPRGNIHNIPLRCGPCGDPNSTHPGPVGHPPQTPCSYCSEFLYLLSVMYDQSLVCSYTFRNQVILIIFRHFRPPIAHNSQNKYNSQQIHLKIHLKMNCILS